MELQERIKEISARGNSWLGPAREFILSLNKANTLLENNNTTEMTAFLKNIGSHHLLHNRQYVFLWQPPYNLVAEGERPFAISRIVAPTGIAPVFAPWEGTVLTDRRWGREMYRLVWEQEESITFSQQSQS